ncbi:hypothetical protein NMY3_03030 [Candidatus Nitrosocosmicus oleophilus]|uniref:DUF4062 domain-containing protein n=1 Tax=Candidatus Nitrosocosmicus oleophilus TaxID=1353260 RepID=A0A654M210_9ARCH|nr:DUF4062 domain-containing protein [Candidatus Nitrosocosmicus oleophilus]ALI37217.1 hypothetical protein NMY3_03030 [Candidatus Nitrosocosmicus oleophilus]
MITDKRYQVFVSSTYEDLIEERQSVLLALQKLGCIPSGMELFTAANEDQWSIIQKVIDECDYYITIIGGRYGSMSQSGISFTEMEYKYAETIKKPVIAFLFKNINSLPANKIELEPKSRKKLDNFRLYVEKRMCQYWISPADLSYQVSVAMIKLIENNPAIGWKRANESMSEDLILENSKLKSQIEHLSLELSLLKNSVTNGINSIPFEEKKLHSKYISDIFKKIQYLHLSHYFNPIQIDYCVPNNPNEFGSYINDPEPDERLDRSTRLLRSINHSTWALDHIRTGQYGSIYDNWSYLVEKRDEYNSTLEYKMNLFRNYVEKRLQENEETIKLLVDSIKSFGNGTHITYNFCNKVYNRINSLPDPEILYGWAQNETYFDSYSLNPLEYYFKEQQSLIALDKENTFDMKNVSQEIRQLTLAARNIFKHQMILLYDISKVIPMFANKIGEIAIDIEAGEIIKGTCKLNY